MECTENASKEIKQMLDPVLMNMAMANNLTRRSVGYGGKSIKVGVRRRFTDLFRMNKTREANPMAPNLVDIVPWVFYDTFAVAANTAVPTLTQMFTVQAGTGGKTQADTNMSLAGQLPSPQWFNMQGLAWIPASTVTQVDINAFLERTFFQFWIHEKVYVMGKGHYYPSPGGMFGQNVGTSTSHFTVGNPIANSVFDLRLPRGLSLGFQPDGNGGQVEIQADGIMGQTINSGQNFRNDVNLAVAWTTDTNIAVRFYCTLHGILSRGVQ